MYGKSQNSYILKRYPTKKNVGVCFTCLCPLFLYIRTNKNEVNECLRVFRRVAFFVVFERVPELAFFVLLVEKVVFKAFVCLL